MMRSISSREIIKQLEADGWYHINTTGDHFHFKHPTKKGRVTVPHPKKDFPKGTVKSIQIQAGIMFV